MLYSCSYLYINTRDNITLNSCCALLANHQGALEIILFSNSPSRGQWWSTNGPSPRSPRGGPWDTEEEMGGGCYLGGVGLWWADHRHGRKTNNLSFNAVPAQMRRKRVVLHCLSQAPAASHHSNKQQDHLHHREDYHGGSPLTTGKDSALIGYSEGAWSDRPMVLSLAVVSLEIWRGLIKVSAKWLRT